MFLIDVVVNFVKVRIPRASGGVSGATGGSSRAEWYSPRKRGCFLSRNSDADGVAVFPAQAGVFPSDRTLFAPRRCIPRASGGVSIRRISTEWAEKYSPRKRGCFQDHRKHEQPPHVFPAQAGCFDPSQPAVADGLVFPAQAGVFPSRCPCRQPIHRIPRASGGVSQYGKTAKVMLQYSPRKRGCFSAFVEDVGAGGVFPAQAGVFPNRHIEKFPIAGIPRASGGVSGEQKDPDDSTEYSPRKRGCF